MTYFDYVDAKLYCEDRGLFWDESMIERADLTFSSMRLTQDQVDVAMMQYIDSVVELFNPKRYGWKGRLLLALHFLLGRRIKPKTKASTNDKDKRENTG